jgi:hypothetical protein
LGFNTVITYMSFGTSDPPMKSAAVPGAFAFA